MNDASVRYRSWLSDSGAGAVMVQSRDGRVVDLFYEPPIAQLVSSWDQFQTLDVALLHASGMARLAAADVRAPLVRRLVECVRRHLLESWRRRPAVARLRALLSTLVEQGALISEAELLARAPDAAGGPPDTPETVVLMVDDRVPFPEALLRQYFELARTRYPDLRILVIDGTRHPTVAAHIMERLRVLRHEYGCEVVYSGRRHLGAVVSALERAGVPRTVLDRTLSGRGGRGALNHVLLATLGERCVIECGRQGALPAVRAGRMGMLRITESFDDHIRSATDGPQREPAGALLADLDGIIGQTVGRVVQLWGAANVSIERPCTHLIDGLVSGEGCVVACWSQRSRTGPGEVATDWRLVHRAYPAGLCALDNRVELPPFVDSDDGRPSFLFQETLAAVMPHGFSVQLPVVDPDDAREPLVRTEAEPRILSSVVAACVAACAGPRHGTSVGRLAPVGARLCEMARLPIADVLVSVAPILMSRPHMRPARRACPRSFDALLDVDSCGGRRERALLQKAIENAGMALRYWPAIVDTVRGGDARGASLSEAV